MKRQIFDYYSPCIVGGKGRLNRGITSGGGTRYRRIFVSAFVAVLFTSALVFGLILYAPFNIRLKKTDFFMLHLSQETTIAAAEEAKQQISIGGGAGYIINDGDFLVAAFVYKSEKDAQNVRERMLAGYPYARVDKYSFGGIKVRRWGERKDEKQLKALLDYPSAFAEAMIEYAVALDSFYATESGVMLELEGVRQRLSQRLGLAQALADTYPAVKATALAQEFYADILSSLSGAMAEGQPQNLLTHRLKSLACEVVYKAYMLRGRLKNL